MLKIAKDVDLRLWDAAGFFRLLSCWQEHVLDEYKKFNDTLIGTRICNDVVTRREDVSGVYILYFKNSAKFYIGSARLLRKRVDVHIAMLKGGKHYNHLMTRASGDKCDMPEVLFLLTETEKQARSVEQRLIDLVFKDPYCLNQRAQVEEYRPSTEETRAKLKAAAEKQWRNEEFSKRIKQIYAKPESLARRIEAGIRNTKDPEYIKKLSEASKAKWKDPEYAEKIKQSGKDVWKDEAFRARHKAAMIEKWKDQEHRARALGPAALARRIPVTIEGVTYTHIGAAASALGLCETTIRKRYLR